LVGLVLGSVGAACLDNTLVGTTCSYTVSVWLLSSGWPLAGVSLATLIALPQLRTWAIGLQDARFAHHNISQRPRDLHFEELVVGPGRTRTHANSSPIEDHLLASDLMHTQSATAVPAVLADPATPLSRALSSRAPAPVEDASVRLHVGFVGAATFHFSFACMNR
jgi:hypothetical protein